MYCTITAIKSTSYHRPLPSNFTGQVIVLACKQFQCLLCLLMKQKGLSFLWQRCHCMDIWHISTANSIILSEDINIATLPLCQAPTKETPKIVTPIDPRLSDNNTKSEWWMSTWLMLLDFDTMSGHEWWCPNMDTGLPERCLEHFFMWPWQNLFGAINMFKAYLGKILIKTLSHIQMSIKPDCWLLMISLSITFIYWCTGLAIITVLYVMKVEERKATTKEKR